MEMQAKFLFLAMQISTMWSETEISIRPNYLDSLRRRKLSTSVINFS